MAKRLTVTQRKLLVSAHVLFSGTWLGIAVCFLALIIVAGGARDGNLFLATYEIIDIVDRILIRPLAVGSAVTGVILSALTPWGLFKFKWIIVKLIATTSLIASGIVIFGLSRTSSELISIISTEGLQALHNPSYESNQGLLFAFVIAEVVFLSASVVISIFKPGGQTDRKRAIHHQNQSDRRAAVS